MHLTFTPMDEASARQMLTWRYAGQYAFYNPDPSQLEESLRAFLDPANAYFCVGDEHGELVAYRCYGPDGQVPGGDYGADALDTGGGMRPDLTGRGLGLGVLEAGLEFGRHLYHPCAFRVTVAAFNARACRVCEKAGFRPVQTFHSPLHDSAFTVLVRDEGGSHCAASLTDRHSVP
jgi:RimJ/RimL family protein N-acetyltransferase